MTSNPLTSEELSAFGRRPSPLFRLPDPRPFVSVGPSRTGRRGVEITVGLKGTF